MSYLHIRITKCYPSAKTLEPKHAPETVPMFQKKWEPWFCCFEKSGGKTLGCPLPRIRVANEGLVRDSRT